MNFLSLEVPCDQLQELSVSSRIKNANNATGSQQILVGTPAGKENTNSCSGYGIPSKRKGMCYKCGRVKTHRKKSIPFHGGAMEPLTIEGEVFEGYCLRCHSTDDIPNFPNGSTRGTIRSSCSKSLGLSFSDCSTSTSVNNKAKRQSGKKSTTLENILIPPLSKGSDRSCAPCAASIETQPTYTSAETSTTTPSQQPRVGKPPLKPRSRIFKDLDVLDYSSADDENSSTFDCGSSVSSNSHRRLHLTQSEDSIELALPRSPESILTDMKDHPADSMVQEFGCAALGQLNLEQMQGLSAAFIEILLTAIVLHGCSNIRIVEESVRTLRRLTFKASKSENSASASIDRRHLEKENCTKIEGRGGVRLALNILKDHPNHQQVQRDSLRIVRNILSCHNDFKKETKYTGVVDSEALQAIIRAMLTHGELKALQEDGCALLWMLAFDNPLYQRKIVEFDGIKAVVNALTTQREVEQIYYHGCGALHVLSCNEDIKPILLEEGILNFAFRWIEEHGYSPLVSEKVCSILSELMVRKRGDTKLCVMHKQEVSSIVRLMNIHSNCRRVQKSALRTLELAARARSNLAILKACKPLRSVIRSAATAFPEECSRSACRLLSALDNR